MKWLLLFITPLFVILNSLFARPVLADWPADCALDYPICSVSLPPGGSLGICLPRDLSINHCTPAGSSVRNGNWCCPAVIPTPVPTSAPACPYSCTSISPALCTAEGGTPVNAFCRPGLNCCDFSALPPGTTPPPGYVPPGTYTSQTPQTLHFDPLKYPCNKTTAPGPEFHPLRPYPASPCDPLIPDKDHVSFACGKSLNVQGSFDFPASVDVASLPVFPDDPNTITDTSQLYRCERACDPTTSTCDVCAIKRVGFDIKVDLTPAELPIIGNTQDPMDDATKVNNYLNWYLNGTVQQSEQLPLNPNNQSDMDRLINFAGPIKKLLPKSLQDALAKTLKGGPIDTAYHNYLVGKNFLGGDVRLNDVLPGLFKNVPLSTLEDITGEVTLGLIPDQQPGNPVTNNSFLPGNQTGDLALVDNDKYFKNGLVYAIVPPGKNAITLTIKPDTYTAPPAGQSAAGTDARAYFPQLRQVNVLLKLLSAMFRPKSAGLANPADKDFLANRGYPAQSKNSDFTTVRDEYPFDQKNNSSVVPGFDAPKPLIDYHGYDQRCDLTEVGINPGDSLSASQITAHLAYTQKFQYTPSHRTNAPGCTADWTLCSGLSDTNCCSGTNECFYNDFLTNVPINAYICRGITVTNPTLPTEARAGVFVKVPLLDQIYDDMVWGYNSIFNRFFFKRGPWEEPRPGGRDIPGAADVIYSGNVVPDAGHQDVPDSDIGVSAGKHSSIAQIYFKHLGSMVDYFLGAGQDNKNLQRLLRPKGFTGAGIITTPAPATSINCIPNLPSDPASLKLCSVATYASNAAAWVGGRGQTNASLCYGDVINRATAAGVDPGFALWIWLHESGSSNYTAFSHPIQDFGINDNSIANNFSAQIAGFLTRPSRYRVKCPAQFAAGINPMRIFVSNYYVGRCDPSSTEQITLAGVTKTVSGWVDYYLNDTAHGGSSASLANSWNQVSCGRPIPNYP